MNMNPMINSMMQMQNMMSIMMGSNAGVGGMEIQRDGQLILQSCAEFTEKKEKKAQ